MALSPLYSPAEVRRRCPDCQGPVEPPRRYCDRDRARRRALTFLYQAERQIDQVTGPAGDAAKRHVNGALGELERP